MAQSQTPQSIFPDLPRSSPAIDENGDFNSIWSLSFSSLFQALQTNFKNEGIVFPPLTASQMTTIQNLYSSYIGGTYANLVNNITDISGQTVYDETTYITNQFVIAVDNSTPPLVTLAQWVPLSVMLTNAGDPNGAVAGVLNWMCYDTLGTILYVCTVAGDSTSTVWAAV